MRVIKLLHDVSFLHKRFLVFGQFASFHCNFSFTLKQKFKNMKIPLKNYLLFSHKVLPCKRHRIVLVQLILSNRCRSSQHHKHLRTMAPNNRPRRFLYSFRCLLVKTDCMHFFPIHFNLPDSTRCAVKSQLKVW